MDAVVAGKIRSTMILEDVWKMTPGNEQSCKIIGSMDHFPQAILIVNKKLAPEITDRLREQAPVSGNYTLYGDSACW